MPIKAADLQQLNDVCNTICFHLTAHLAAVAAGVPSNLPPEVGQIYQLASRLPKAEPSRWLTLAPGAAAPPGGGEAGGKASGGGGARNRLKWTAELEAELVRLVDDEAYRAEKLGKEGSRGNAVNWAAVARHYGYSGSGSVKAKYEELKGEPLPKREKRESAAGEEKAAKKAKGEAAPPPAPAAPAAADGEPTPAGGDKWTKEQERELVKLVESEEARKAAFGKKKLRWKRIAEHFDKKLKSCRKHYHKATGKDAPEDDE